MASTNTWQLPEAAYITGTVACCFSAAFRPSPPRGMIRSTTPSWVASCSSSERSPPPTIEMASPGSPASAIASRATAASAAFELAAIDEPRRTMAFPDLMHSAEQSIVTFGRAS